MLRLPDVVRFSASHGKWFMMPCREAWTIGEEGASSGREER